MMQIHLFIHIFTALQAIFQLTNLTCLRLLRLPNGFRICDNLLNMSSRTPMTTSLSTSLSTLISPHHNSCILNFDFPDSSQFLEHRVLLDSFPFALCQHLNFKSSLPDEMTQLLIHEEYKDFCHPDLFLLLFLIDLIIF